MFRDLPIKLKLTLLAMLTSASALLLAGAACGLSMKWSLFSQRDDR